MKTLMGDVTVWGVSVTVPCASPGLRSLSRLPVSAPGPRHAVVRVRAPGSGVRVVRAPRSPESWELPVYYSVYRTDNSN